MKPWIKQKFLKKEKIPEINQVIDLAKSITNERNRCLFILTYITAGRLQELVRYNRGKEKRESIKPTDLKLIEKEGKKILLINIRNEKNKKRFRKDIPFPLYLEENKKLYNEIIDYINSISFSEELFPIGYKRAYKILTDITPNWNPHWIRHIRLTHLVTKYKYREHQLMLYAGWTDARPSKHYLEMRWEDLLY